MTTQLLQEVPAEILRKYIGQLTGDNAVLLSAGSINLFNSSVVNCRFATDLTFKPVAACFIRPQKHVIRFVENNKYFTLSYFPPEHQHILNVFGAKSEASVNTPDINNIKAVPKTTLAGNVYYPQARLVLECRKVFNLELILSPEIQSILLTEKAREIYPGNEAPRMFIGEVEHCWMGVQALLSR